MQLRASLLRFLKRHLPGGLIVWRGSRNCNAVALTFDDGPYRDNTEKILEILEQHRIKATFFMCGKDIEKNMEIVNKVIDYGHEVVSHLYSHRPVKDLSYAELKSEIVHWKNLMKNVLPGRSFNKLLRPPHGKLDLKILWFAWRYGWTIILWSLDTRDLDEMSLEDNIKSLDAVPLRGGEIILLHDDAGFLEQRLEWIIRKIRDDGFVFRKVSGLLQG